MVTHKPALRYPLVAALVLQLGLAGTLGWLHLAAHDHAFSPDLRVLVDTSSRSPHNKGVSPEERSVDHFGVLLAIAQDSEGRSRAPASIAPDAPPVLYAEFRDLIPQRNPRQQPLLSMAPSLPPPRSV